MFLIGYIASRLGRDILHKEFYFLRVNCSHILRVSFINTMQRVQVRKKYVERSKTNMNPTLVADINTRC